MYSNAARAYFNTKVTTTTQEEIVVLLYEAAIKFLGQAKIKIKEKDYQEKGNLISKALDIIAELDASLNVDKGGELAQNLHSLYLFCQTRLLMANLKMDTSIIDEVIEMLRSVGSAFAEINNSQKLN
ncbi:MAG: flagellar export chaperone FliS [Desulfonatronovibrio sp.]